MSALRYRFVAAVVIALAASPALAQTQPAAIELPAACLATETGAGATDSMAGMAPIDSVGSMDEAHQELMATMTPMNEAMAQGMKASDIDVAFVCGMIAHHHGAIDMARVELERGDDAWAREMAQKVIDAQTQEIADMTSWLDKQPK